MIQVLTAERLCDVHTANDPFPILGRLRLTYKEGVWTSEECLFESTTEKRYPIYDGALPADYLDSEDRILYLAYEANRCIGQILIARAWNRYAHIEDIAVTADHRGKGVGSELMSHARTWALSKGLRGLSLESQDNNLLASRFFHKQGMHIGGVNTSLYRHLGKPYEDETAVFWYLDF